MTTDVTSHRHPVDHAIRDRATSAIDQSMALSAGAGAGKTTILVERLLELLRGGTPPERIAAITFTRKATAEVEERIRDTLEEQLAGATGAERERLEQTLDSLSKLHISTVHAFCQKLLQREALEAGWSPGTEIVDESLSTSAVDTAHAAWREGFNARHPDHGWQLTTAGSDRSLKEAACAMLANRDLEPVVGEREPRWAEAAAELREHLAEARDAADACTNPDGCTLLRNGLDLVLLARACADLDDEALVRRALHDTKIGIAGGRKGDWPDGSKDRFKAAAKAMRDTWCKRWSSIEWEPVHRVVMDDLREHFLPSVEEAKVAGAQADYQDLLFRAAHTLVDRPTARRRLAARYDAILVDEVQDTDPIQSEVVALLTRAASLDGPWDAHPPQPGHLFAVGDHKQSIYRFRRADPAQWKALHEVVARDGLTGDLQQNFRSVPGVVSWVNHTFASMPDYVPLVPWRGEATLDPVVALYADGADDEADAVVRYLRRLEREGAPVRWRDVMLLLPSWSKAETLQDTMLRAGIPCVVEGGKKFFERDEVKLCVAAMRAIDEPADSEAIVATLRGLFGVSIDEMAAYVAAGGDWRYTAPGIPPGPVADALAVLRSLHREREERAWDVILDELLEQTRAPAVWSLTTRGAAMLANLDKLRALVRKAEEHARTPAEVVETIEALRKDGEDRDLSFVDDDTDAVSILTYFGAKGLEAPVVVLPYASRKLSYPTGIVDRESGRIAIKAGKELQPPGWDDWYAKDREEQEAERQRWMYVAATRARDQLVVLSNADSRGGKSCLLEPHLAAGIPQADETTHDGVVDYGEGVSVRTVHASALDAPTYIDEIFPGLDDRIDALLGEDVLTGDASLDAWREERLAKTRRASRATLRWASSTDLASTARRASRKDHVTRDATRCGTLVHEVMEHLDLTRPTPELVEEASALAEAFGASVSLSEPYIDDAKSILRRLLDHPVIERARNAPERWHEVPFAFQESGRVVAGTIDLCFPVDAERTHWVVVDWKSKLPEPGDPRRDDYERQLETYARAVVATLTGVEPHRVERVLAGPHPETTPDAAEARDEVLSMVAGELVSGLAALLDAGVPLPEVGADLGTPLVIATDVELVWHDEKFCVALDEEDAVLERMRSAGFEVVVVDTFDIGWSDTLIEKVAARFGVAEIDATAEEA